MLFASTLTFAQRPAPELHSLNPPVVTAGQTVEITVAGANLDDLDELHFSDPKISAKRVMLPKTEFQKFAKPNGNKFSVTIPADAKPGIIEVRAAGYFGLSTSRPMVVAAKDTPLVRETGAANHQLETAPDLPRDGVAFGIIDASQHDYWKIAAKAGERLTMVCRSEFLDSQADATLVVKDGAGNVLARNRDGGGDFGRDPVVDFTAPADGNFWVGVHDYLFNGGANFFYTLTVSAKPHIDFAWPPAVEAGKTTRVKLFGRNLPGGSLGEGFVKDGVPLETIEVDVTAPGEVKIPASFSARRPSHGLLPGFDFSHQNSNAIRLGFAQSSVTLENPGGEGEQKIAAIPAEIVGRFNERAETDRFRFTAKKGTAYWVESISDRFASGTDPFVLVEKISKAEDGTETFARVRDDDDESGTGGAKFDTTTRDGQLTFTADVDGEYRVSILNQFASAGPEKIYRLVIREAKPDFELLAILERPVQTGNQRATTVPLVRKNGTAAVRVALTRRDGFNEAVEISATSLPPGISAKPITIDPASSVGYLVFRGTAETAGWNGKIEIQGKSVGGNVVKAAQVGGIPWAVADNRTARTRARLDLEMPLSISQHEPEILRLELLEPDKPLVVEMDGTIEIKFRIADEVKGKRKGNLAVAPFGLHGLGSKPPTINISDKNTDGIIKLAAKKTANVFTPVVGKHSFVLRGTGTSVYVRNPEALARAKEEQTFVAGLQKKIDTDLAAAKKDLAAATEDAKAAAQKRVADLETRKKSADAEKKAADARVTAATNAAKAKDTPFVVFSEPIVLEIREKKLEGK